MSDSAQVHAVLAPQDGPRVVGMRARARNLKVLARAGAQVVEAGSLSELQADTPVVALRADLTIGVALFDRLAEARNRLDGGPLRIVAEDGAVDSGAFLLFGTAADVDERLDAYLAGDPCDALPAQEVNPRSLLSMAGAGAASAATLALLRQAEKPTDGIVSRKFNRPLSRFFSRIFLALGMTPMHASVLNMLIGLACAYYAAQTGYWTMALAGFLFHLASAFDGVDGEMARSTLSESNFGAWVDTTVDTGTYVACLIGVTIGWLREGVGTGGQVLAVLVVLGVPLTLLSLMRFVLPTWAGRLPGLHRSLCRAGSP